MEGGVNYCDESRRADVSCQGSPMAAMEERKERPMAAMEGRKEGHMAAMEGRKEGHMAAMDQGRLDERKGSPMAAMEERKESPMAAISRQGSMTEKKGSPMAAMEGRKESPMAAMDQGRFDERKGSPMAAMEGRKESPMAAMDSERKGSPMAAISRQASLTERKGSPMATMSCQGSFEAWKEKPMAAMAGQASMDERKGTSMAGMAQGSADERKGNPMAAISRQGSMSERKGSPMASMFFQESLEAKKGNALLSNDFSDLFREGGIELKTPRVSIEGYMEVPMLSLPPPRVWDLEKMTCLSSPLAGEDRSNSHSSKVLKTSSVHPIDEEFLKEDLSMHVLPQLRRRRRTTNPMGDTTLTESSVSRVAPRPSIQVPAKWRASTDSLEKREIQPPSRCGSQALQRTGTLIMLCVSILALLCAQTMSGRTRHLQAEVGLLHIQQHNLQRTVKVLKLYLLSKERKLTESEEENLHGMLADPTHDSVRSMLGDVERGDNVGAHQGPAHKESTLERAKRLQTEEDYVVEPEKKGSGAKRNAALLLVVVLLFGPMLMMYYMDPLADFLRSRHRNGRKKVEPGIRLSKRVAYQLDVLFSRYAVLKPVALLLATLALIGLGGLALFAVGSEGLGDATWLAWTYVADAGTHADSIGTGPRIVSVLISSGGMLVFALMLGLVSDTISDRVDSLRKGKSDVIESDHTLILGWSDKLGSLLKQLAIANKSCGGGVVVILAEMEKEDMELNISRMGDLHGTIVICRSGSPLIMADLKKVSVSTARSIIVLAEVENADQSDARALRVVLSLTGVREGLRGHIVVEISDLDNEQLVRLVGGDLVETLVAHDVIGRLMIQCARQPGLAQIWEDFLGFENAEFYMKRHPEMDGMCFGDAHISFADAVPCGIKVASEGGRIMLNPDDDYILRLGDEILVVAEDDNTYYPGPIPKIRRGPLPKVGCPTKLPEKFLLVGWRRDIDDMIMVLDVFLAKDSEIWMLNEVPVAERTLRLIEGGLDPDKDLINIKLVHRRGNAVIRRHLETLPLETFNSILILADEHLEDSIVKADSRSLATLLLIRDIQSKRILMGRTRTRQQPGTPASTRHHGGMQSKWVREMQQASTNSIIISEILDSTTKNLVAVSKISDYVLSNELVSMALAMVAEDKQMNRVLEELFSAHGNEMYIRPADLYVTHGEELNFFEIMVRGRQRKEIVIGYRLESAERAILNPPEKLKLRRWSVGDSFVVLALES